MRHLVIEKAGDGLATLILDNADEPVNIVSEAWLVEMEGAINALRDDAAVACVIIRSAKPSFMAGADLKFLVKAFESMDRSQAYSFSQRATWMHRALETMGKPVVAAINGLCLGGGLELALASHFRVLEDSSTAKVGFPEVNVGLLPGSGGTQRLVRIAGVKAAKELLLSGRSIGPAEALGLGIVDAIAPASGLLDRARSLVTGGDPQRAWDKRGFSLPETRGLISPEVGGFFSASTAEIAGKFGYNLPAPAAILSCLFEGVQLPFDKALSVESKYFAVLLTNPVARNIIRTNFVNKRAAEKGARRPAGYEKRDFVKVGVLGAGMMGAGVALVAAKSGLEVVLIDRDQATADKGKGYSEKVLSGAVKKGQFTRKDADTVLGRIVATDDYDLLAGADLVVEAVFEDIDIKTGVTRRAEAVLSESATFASNTSTLPISRLAEASVRPANFIGLHFFSPVDRMALVEIIVGHETDDRTLASALDFVARLGKTPIVVNDSRGFYTSRVFQMFINEGAAMLADGIEPTRIENAARAAGFPLGPLALLDEVTIDLPIKIVAQATEQEGGTFAPPAGMPAMYRMRDAGRTSRKTGGGFYEYSEDGEKRLWPGLKDLFPPVGSQPAQDELKVRFLYAQAMETIRCLEEGVLAAPEDADLGSVLGWGFPSWTGGTLSFVDTVGIAKFVAEADRLAQIHGARFLPSEDLRVRASRNENFYASTAAERQRTKACAA